MLGVLVGLCVFFSFITFEEQQPVGKSGAERLVETIEAEFPDLGSVIFCLLYTSDAADE